MTARYKFSVTTGDGTVLTRKSLDDYGYQWAAYVKTGEKWRVAYSKTRAGAANNLGDYYQADPTYGVGPVTKTEIAKRAS